MSYVFSCPEPATAAAERLPTAPVPSQRWRFVCTPDIGPIEPLDLRRDPRASHGELNSSSVMRYVTIEKASDLTGYTPDAIRSKIKRGDWLEGAVWQRAPDGRVLIDLQGYEKWVEGSLQHLACGFGLRNRSRSTSTMVESVAESD